MNKNHRIRNRIAIALLIITVYLMGRHIVLPYLDGVEINQQTIQRRTDIFSVTSMSTATYSIFGLGVTAWMFTTIMWRVLEVIFKKTMRELSVIRKHVYQTTVMSIILLGQAYVKTFEFRETIGFHSADMGNMIRVWMVLLISGAFFLVWLINMNSTYGIGGASIIIIVNLISNIISQFGQLYKDRSVLLPVRNEYIFIFILSVVMLVFLMLILTIEKAEFRIPMHRVMLQRVYSEKTYLPLKLNSAGSIAIIYSLTLFQLVVEGIKFALSFFKEAGNLEALYERLVMTDIIGICLYWLILACLTFTFAQINIMADELSEQITTQGDYIDGIRPGKATDNYLKRVAHQIGFVNVILVMGMVGVPILIGYFHPEHSYVGLMPGSLWLLTTIILGLVDQVVVFYIPNRYRNIFSN